MYVIYADDEVLYQPDLENHELLSAVLNTQIGKAGTLEFDITPNHPMYSGFTPLKTEILVQQDGEVIFRGRVLYSKRDIYGVKSVYCEGDLAYLNDSIQRPYNFSGYPIDQLKQYINAHNEEVDDFKKFTIGNIEVFPQIDESQIHNASYTTTRKTVTTGTCQMRGGPSDQSPLIGTVPAGAEVTIKGYSGDFTYINYAKIGNGYIHSGNTKTITTTTQTSGASNPFIVKTENSSYNNTLDEINSKIIDVYGGYLQTRYENGVRYLDIVKQFTQTAEQAIEFGVNLLDLNDHITAQDVYTVMIPLGASNNSTKLTISSANNGSDMLESTEGIAIFGRVVKTVEFADIKDATELKTKAEAALTEGIKQALTVTVDAVDMTLVGVDTDHLRCGTKIKVISKPHGLNSYMLCTAVSCNLLVPENTTYTIGDTFRTLTDRQNKQSGTIKTNASVMGDIGARVTIIEEKAEQENT